MNDGNRGHAECWRTCGVMGDRTCADLAVHRHCRNCPAFARAGLSLLDRPPPEGLREEWTQRVAEPPSASTDRGHAVQVFRLGHEWLALPGNAFLEIVDPQPIRPLPHRDQPVLLGLTSVRGAIHLCVSLAALLHIHPDAELPEAERSRLRAEAGTGGGTGRFCLLGDGGGTWVFPADDVLGMHRYRDEELEAVPATVPGTVQFMAQGILPVGGRRVGLLDPDLLFHAFERSAQ